ncbi:PhzF family phenazine biosynthesis protein [uncultured Megasphaera sp.]|uniref:PhzF family phenazine biosynthesis protein n=1 Tax=uncultured Megasphaera sp. TaxID=165188 RepID=UPI0025F8B56F|nr:PhzF family phenazine biosynthesis protein [uncultured Megasphaera sp.]
MKQYVVDAFTEKVFTGNPAAVCVMDTWLNDQIMQNIAVENNLSETAFAVKEGAVYHLRWFTPGGEVELCGHATLATAYVITRFVEPKLKTVTFHTLSGILTVEKQDDLLVMNFPSFQLQPVPVTEQMTAALGVKPVEAYCGADMVCVLENEEQVKNVHPNQDLIRQMEGVCLHITALGNEYDCVTRSFAPKCNVAEDPVCGRGHCHVIPYWADRTGKTEFIAYQASARGGVLYCSYAGEHTVIRGRAALFAEAELFV